jgi:hypothetical protein
MEERRRYVRDAVKAAATLERSSIKAEVFDLSEKGIGLRIPKAQGHNIPAVDMMRLSPKDKRQEPCTMEVALKWNETAKRSSLAGFEIRSQNGSSCKDILDGLGAAHRGEPRSRHL